MNEDVEPLTSPEKRYLPLQLGRRKVPPEMPHERLDTGYGECTLQSPASESRQAAQGVRTPEQRNPDLRYRTDSGTSATGQVTPHPSRGRRTRLRPRSPLSPPTPTSQGG